MKRHLTSAPESVNFCLVYSHVTCAIGAAWGSVPKTLQII